MLTTQQQGVTTIRVLGKVSYNNGQPVVKGKMIDAVHIEWNSTPEETVDEINELLADHGLEVIGYDDGTDMYMFGVVKKKA